MTPTDDTKAKAIAEEVLEISGRAILKRDFDTFADCFHLPHVIETPDQKTVLKDRPALRIMFDQVAQKYLDQRVTRLVRICEFAEFKTPKRLHATHTSHMMSGDQRIGEPFAVFSVFELFGDRWQSSASQYAIDKKTLIGSAFEACLEELSKALQENPDT